MNAALHGPSPQLGLAHGLKSVFRAFGILWRRPRILLWLTPALLITLLLDALAFYFAFGSIRAGLGRWLSGDGYVAWLRTVFDFLGAAAVIFVLGWTFAWLFLALASPFQEFISAAVERERRGVAGSEPAGFRGFLRSLAQNVAQAMALISLTVLFLIVALIPFAGPILFFLWTAFALGYSFVAIPSGRMAQRFSERWAFARRHWGAVLGLGLAIVLLSLAPLANVLFMPLFVVAGTVLYLDGTDEARYLEVER